VHACGRLKLWLGMLRRHYPAAGRLHEAVRRVVHPARMNEELRRHGIPARDHLPATAVDAPRQTCTTTCPDR